MTEKITSASSDVMTLGLHVQYRRDLPMKGKTVLRAYHPCIMRQECVCNAMPVLFLCSLWGTIGAYGLLKRHNVYTPFWVVANEGERGRWFWSLGGKGI